MSIVPELISDPKIEPAIIWLELIELAAIFIPVTALLTILAVLIEPFGMLTLSSVNIL